MPGPDFLFDTRPPDGSERLPLSLGGGAGPTRRQHELGMDANGSCPSHLTDAGWQMEHSYIAMLTKEPDRRQLACSQWSWHCSRGTGNARKGAGNGERLECLRRSCGWQWMANGTLTKELVMDDMLAEEVTIILLAEPSIQYRPVVGDAEDP